MEIYFSERKGQILQWGRSCMRYFEGATESTGDRRTQLFRLRASGCCKLTFKSKSFLMGLLEIKGLSLVQIPGSLMLAECQSGL
jgi:hypothetical protein